MKTTDILNLLPYSEPFLFVDELELATLEKVIGSYTFKKDLDFYKGHFRDFPITPGVILVECMVQIGLCCMGIMIMENENAKDYTFGLGNTSIDFLLPVLPGEKVKVISEKVFCRYNKLKCKVKMINEKDEVIARGTISGMINIFNYTK